MRLEAIFLTFASLAVASAVPVLQEYPAVPMPTPTKPVIASSSAAYSSPSASISAPVVPVGPYSCPQKQYKQCCQSLAQTSHDIIKPLGELVPILGGIQISSAVSFQCRNMRPNEPPEECDEPEYRPMCCSAENTGAVNSCKLFEKAKEDYYRSFGFGEEDQVELINDVLT
ncbi:hypothetical protein N7509_012607 [Penicillium cosmopolitanum]|uniref:Hydrophobin n=1 Tax=Penicillium cosmopolitanum TaxID=1131564 RepID=A0A9W9SJ61_9EURO|nr:uncharacterized protein N7509_012607 [Penicillium cosmopolitanum]KAJ5379488.1 hypothetical protein N7509_012607 [Penicillium cosmopolitanum]